MRPHISGPGFTLILFSAFCILVKAVNDLGQEGAVGGSRAFNWTSNVPVKKTVVPGSSKIKSQQEKKPIASILEEYANQQNRDYEEYKMCADRFNQAPYADDRDEVNPSNWSNQRFYRTKKNTLQSLSIKVRYEREWKGGIQVVTSRAVTDCKYGYEWSIDEWRYIVIDAYNSTFCNLADNCNTGFRSVVSREHKDLAFIRMYKNADGRIYTGYNIMKCLDQCTKYSVLNLSDFLNEKRR